MFILGSALKFIQVVSGFSLEFKVLSKNLYPVIYFLKTHSLCLFSQVLDIVCIDFPKKKIRFLLVYILVSIVFNFKIRIFSGVTELGCNLISLVSLFRSVNWVEREVFDFYGVFFFEHFDLRRILTDYGFKGFPLRKDFPVTGFVDIFFDDVQKKIVYRSLELSQEFRNFNFKNS